MIWAIGYLLVGIFLAEGGEWALNLKGRALARSTYVFIIALWPLVIASLIFFGGPTKGRDKE